MVTIQSKISRGHKYWYIVESKRVNGKPRPVVLAYLGKADSLLRRLKGITSGIRLKSYSHGGVGALLDIASKLNTCPIINKYTESKRPYRPKKPISNNLTAGITLTLAATGRALMPTSKRGWLAWAKTTSLGYLLGLSLKKIDSQHFWDLMDAVPVENIAKIEAEILANVFRTYDIKTDSLFFDTTNFFTYIDSTNTRSTIAKRGKNKQKRNDLRQVGLAVVVSKADMIPLFHLSYDGNTADTTVFRKVTGKLVKRLEELGLDKGGHTIVFDRGANSKKNLAVLKNLGLHYVGALTPYHHKKLIEEAKDSFSKINVSGSVLKFYRAKKLIWGEQRTVVIFISSKLKAGRIRGIYQSLKKIEQSLEKLKASLASPRAKKRDRGSLEEKIEGITGGQYVGNIVNWSLEEVSEGRFKLDYLINYQMLEKIEEDLGFRIIMTNRHSWDTASIIEAYHGQSRIESAFKNLKNPYHLTIKPQFHWTDDKVRVHMFICVLGYLLATIAWRKVRLLTEFSGTLDTLLDTLNNIRLATVLQELKTPGPVKAIYKLEETSDMENEIMEALNIKDLHNKRPKIKGVGVYS